MFIRLHYSVNNSYVLNHKVCNVVGHTDFGEITQNNGHYAIQGHAGSPIFGERRLMFSLAIMRHVTVCRLSVTFVRPTQAIEIFGNVSTPFGTLAICDLSIKILRRSSQGNPYVGRLNARGVAKYSDFEPFEGYISKTIQNII